MSDKPQRPTPRATWTAPFLWAEWALEWAAHGLSRFAAFQILEHLGKLAVLTAVVFWFTEAPERRRDAQRAAWQVINLAHGQPGSGGRREAIEFLHGEGVPLQGLSAPRAYLAGISMRGAKLQDADLSSAILTMAHLPSTILISANLTATDLLRASLPYAASPMPISPAQT